MYQIDIAAKITGMFGIAKRKAALLQAAFEKYFY